MSKGPILIELEEDEPKASPASAPPVPDVQDVPEGAAMRSAIELASRKPSRLARWFFSLIGALLMAVLSVAAWDFANGLVARAPILGYVVTALFAALIAVLVVIALRELAAFSRLKRLDTLRRNAEAALNAHSLEGARGVAQNLQALYKNRDELAWAQARFDERKGDPVDAEALMALAERELLEPLDALAIEQVEAAARQVATVTAIVPLALADVVAALTANIRMIRRIAEVYGGRSGTLGNWRLVKAVMAHLVATGAVAVGDDMLGSLAGGGVLGRLSRRFGEGVINGALTARVGVAAIEVCRPLPFTAVPRPKVTSLVSRALKGLFGGAKEN